MTITEGRSEGASLEVDDFCGVGDCSERVIPERDDSAISERNGMCGAWSGVGRCTDQHGSASEADLRHFALSLNEHRSLF